MNPDRPHPLRSTLLFGALVLAASGLSPGCGGDSNGDVPRPGDAFVGRWALDPDSGPYTMSGCADASLNGNWYVWDDMVFEYGELSDLMEVSGTCSSYVESTGGASSIAGLSYDVSGDTATVSAKSPFSGDAPYCLTSLGSDGLGYPVGLRLTPDPTSWQFTLTPKAGGEPRRAEYGVKERGAAAVADVVSVDADGNLVILDTCSLVGRGTFFRYSTN
jgi:hypothetical protein